MRKATFFLAIAFLVVAAFGCATDSSTRTASNKNVISDRVFTQFSNQESWRTCVDARLVKYESADAKLDRLDDVVSLLPSEKLERRCYLRAVQ